MQIKLPSFLIFAIPSLVYWLVMKRRGLSNQQIAKNLGLVNSSLKFYLPAVGVAISLAILSYLLYKTDLIPEGWKHFSQENSAYSGWPRSFGVLILIFFLEGFSVALGEEVFFRGFLGGIFMRRFGYMNGNLCQIIVFTLFHIPVLLVNQSTWPLILIGIPVVGWFTGYLFHRSGSVLPSWLFHTISNTATTFLALA